MKKLFALLCVIAILGALCVPAMAASNVPVVAQVPDGWTTAYLYAWDAEGGSNAAWPGAAMTKGDDGFWTAEVAPGYTNLIIAEKDGGLQTVDLTSDGNECWIALTAQNDEGKFEATVTADAPADFVAPEITVTPEPAPETPAAPAGDASVQITVYAMVPAEWTNVRLWAWDSGSANPEGTGDWPGTLNMTKGDDGWYSYTVSGQYNNMLINADGVQTGDLSVEAKPEVWLDCTDPANVGIYYEKPSIEAPKPTEAPEPTPTQPSTSTPGTDIDTEGGMDTGLIIGIVVAVAAVIAGAVVIFFVLKKK